jgi:hypothetical protein
MHKINGRQLLHQQFYTVVWNIGGVNIFIMSKYPVIYALA